MRHAGWLLIPLLRMPTDGLVFMCRPMRLSVTRRLRPLRTWCLFSALTLTLTRRAILWLASAVIWSLLSRRIVA